MPDKKSPWLILYASMQRPSGETDLILTRSKALELETDYIIKMFVDGRISAIRAEEMIRETKGLHESAPEIFDLH